MTTAPQTAPDTTHAQLTHRVMQLAAIGASQGYTRADVLALATLVRGYWAGEWSRVTDPQTAEFIGLSGAWSMLMPVGPDTAEAWVSSCKLGLGEHAVFAETVSAKTTVNGSLVTVTAWVSREFLEDFPYDY